MHWRLAVDGAIWGTPALADLNGDGKPEIVLSSIEPFGSTSSGPQPRPARGPDATSESSGPPGVRGVVSFISLAGQCLHRLVVDAPVECSAVVADLDGDQRLEVLVADQSGMLHCYRTAGYGPVEWGLFGGDSHNTRNYANAYAYGQTAHGFQWRWKPE